MISHAQIRAAAHAHALTLSVCTTGSTTLSATATGYARAAGSFLTDGFRAGMEVAPTGFTQTAVGVIEAVDATTMTIVGGRTVAAAASGRTLSVGMPEDFVAENEAHTPVSGVPYALETYLNGALVKVGQGTFGIVEATPLYLLRLALPIATGPDAMDAYMDALLDHFASGTPLTLANGDVAHVRGDIGPSASQGIRSGDRWTSTFTANLRVRSANSR